MLQINQKNYAAAFAEDGRKVYKLGIYGAPSFLF